MRVDRVLVPVPADGESYRIKKSESDIIAGDPKSYAVTAWISFDEGGRVPRSWRELGYRRDRVFVVLYCESRLEAVNEARSYAATHKRSPTWMPTPVNSADQIVSGA